MDLSKTAMLLLIACRSGSFIPLGLGSAALMKEMAYGLASGLSQTRLGRSKRAAASAIGSKKR
jgi:hypothetical protein